VIAACLVLGSLVSRLASADTLSTATLDTVRGLYRQLIEAEDRHDIAAVRRMAWQSPSMLFVAKTATPAEGNWAGFWGTDVAVAHIKALFDAGNFHIDPDYAAERDVGLSTDVVETCVPVKISVAYAGQTPVPKPFLMILEWVRSPDGWRMATDIALPIPPT
jgi:hypothetical protein